MASNKVQPKKKGRGRPATGKGLPIQVRLQPDDLELLDLWISVNAPGVTRSEGLRRIMRLVAMRLPKA
jgi:hypothetical protein